ncbi:hypothetical protein UFOVP766_10 [uncultured Caudovirales phage]|uniref:Uncharacterized protein n=1 Tax=uncultured Caudovirales phage TaxID=2100421 RepID=A0A6J5NP71_9CAUD|nr:hypothetical protein UFOVP766_10 [uncultured Caudovirales phage]
MADLSVTPVAAQIKPVPNMSLGDMVNLARGAQAYQQSEQMNPLLLQQQKQVVGTGQIALTLEQQKEAERQRLIPFLQDPRNLQSDGRFDINKLNADILKLAPLTGSEFIQKFTQLSTLQTESDRAIQNLTNDERNVVASSLGALGRQGVTDRARVYDTLNEISNQYSKSPSMKRLIDSYKGQLSLADQRADLPSMLIGAANQVMSAQAQAQQFSPQATTVDTGLGIYPAVVQPSVTGEAPSQTVGQFPIAVRQLGPSQGEEISGTDPLTNLPIVTTRDPSGAIIGQRLLSGTPSADQMPGRVLQPPIGSARPPMAAYQRPMVSTQVTPVGRIPPGETPETVNQARQVIIKALESAQSVPLQNFNNNEIIKLADEALTGRGAGTLANLTGGYAVFNAVGLGGGNATALNQLGHYMALQTASLAQSAGLGTDAARNIAAESTGTINWTPDAIKKTARVNRSLATATDLFNQGIQSAFQRTKNPLSAREFQNRWSQSADINAIRLFDAMRNNDPDGFREVVDSAGGPQSPGFNRLKTKVEEIKRLVGMQ